MAKNRRVFVSKEAKNKYKQNNNKPILIESLFPADRSDCKCQEELAKIKKGMSRPYIKCPRSEEAGMSRYTISCKNCKSTIAHIYATDNKLTDWCDLHYVCEHGENEWRGCMAVNVSPIDQTLGFECTCGQDSRDFRANTTLPPQQAEAIEKENSKGREFGKPSSYFTVKKYKEE